MKINKKKLKYGTAAAVITIVVIALVILLNVIVAMLGDRVNMKFDLTPNGNFEISDKTKDYLASMNEDVEICTTVDEMLFQTTENIYYRQAYEVLKKYAQNSDRITVNFVDMTANPTFVEKYKQYYSGSISEYSVIIFNEQSNRIKVISVNDLFNTEINYYTMSQNIVSSKAEQVLTSSLMYVTDPDPKTAVYLNVVSQSTSGENITDMLESNGFDVVQLDPLTEEIPMDADMIVINSPLNDFDQSLIDTLYEFMENNGSYGKNMIYLASAYQNATPNIDAFLAEWGIKIGNGIVGETNNQNLASATSAYAIRSYIGENDYTGGIPTDTFENPVVAYNSRPVETLFDTFGNVTAIGLLKTADTAFVMTNEMMTELSETGELPEFEEQSVGIIALSNKYAFIDGDQKLSNLIVFGTDYLLDRSFTSQTYYNNGDYFISIVNKISGKENGIYIVPKDLTSTTYETSDAQISSLRTVFMFIIPAVVAAIGIIVWLRRRHK
ncbi:MAG: GldG family protein [Oscillospiraceae bacterium]|nr:GldG family protein [Oscillospiraceae bacterium]